MSVCNCPQIGLDGLDGPEQKHLVASFLAGLDQSPESAEQWSMLSLVAMYNSGNSLEDIAAVVPFRGGPCPRSMRCCGVCTRQCSHRCVQDCLHRVFMWRQLLESTTSTEREKLPLNIRLIAHQRFETHEQLSWAVGDILSKHKNVELKEYMKNANIHPNNNPYKIDYASQAEMDPHTGKRMCDANTGELRILAWPQSGLCPYCLPDVTIDGRTARAAIRRMEQRNLQKSFD